MTDNKNVEEKPESIIVNVPSIEIEVEVGTPTLWLTYPFAKEWFEDALHEANTGTDHNARRREIVFAVSFAESYIFEWVRDEILDKRDFQKLVSDLHHYFPINDRRGITQRWKDVTKNLLDEKRIPATPNLGLPYWKNFKNLVEMRNGLVHARSSRPESVVQAEKENPYPSKGDLDKLPAGWATETTLMLVKELHKAVGTPEPKWLVTP